jgi:hypothetical protein
MAHARSPCASASLVTVATPAHKLSRTVRSFCAGHVGLCSFPPACFCAESPQILVPEPARFATIRCVWVSAPLVRLSVHARPATHSTRSLNVFLSLHSGLSEAGRHAARLVTAVLPRALSGVSSPMVRALDVVIVPSLPRFLVESVALSSQEHQAIYVLTRLNPRTPRPATRSPVHRRICCRKRFAPRFCTISRPT